MDNERRNQIRNQIQCFPTIVEYLSKYLYDDIIIIILNYYNITKFYPKLIIEYFKPP